MARVLNDPSQATMALPIERSYLARIGSDGRLQITSPIHWHWRRRYTRFSFFIIIVIGHLAKNRTSHYVNISLFARQQDADSSLEMPMCTLEQISTIRQQLPPGDCIWKRDKPWEQKCSLSYATRCPDAVWLERHYAKLHSAKSNDVDKKMHRSSRIPPPPSSSPQFIGVFVGCNKGFDAVNALRMGSGNKMFDRDVWRRAMTEHGTKDLDRAVCSQATSAQFALPSDENKANRSTSASVHSGEEVSSLSSLPLSQVHCIEPMPDTVRGKV